MEDRGALVSPEYFLEATLSARQGSVSAFLDDVFRFLASRTNFYQAPCDEPEKIVLRAFRDFHPDNNNVQNNNNPWPKNVFLPATIAHEVEISTSEDQQVESFSVVVDNKESIQYESNQIENVELSQSNQAIEDLDIKSLSINCNSKTSESKPPLNEPKVDIQSVESDENFVPDQPPSLPLDMTNPDSFNGAVREKYSWSQTIAELDVTIKMPEGITSKRLRINTTADTILVEYLGNNSEWNKIIKDKLSYKIRPSDTVWVVSEGFIRIHLEKHSERWWSSLLENEPKLDTTKFNCSRPLHELPDDHLEKIREVQFNHYQKLAGKPTTDEMKTEEILKKAWNAPGSPFQNTPYDPNVLSN